jgi:CrcB protein
VNVPGVPSDPGAPRDPDVDLRIPAQRLELAGHRLDVLGVIAAGGVIGAEARYGLGLLLPHTAAGFPTATLLINAVGCGLIGVLMPVIAGFVEPHRLVRPFIGVGILGGFTTFSTYCTDTLGLVHAGRAALALLYMAITPIIALIAVWAGVVSTNLAAGAFASRRAVDDTGSRS